MAHLRDGSVDVRRLSTCPRLRLGTSTRARRRSTQQPALDVSNSKIVALASPFIYTLRTAGVRRFEELMNHEFPIVSLFSGAGGLDLGFHQAGFRTTVAVEIWTPAMRTLSHNFPEVTLLASDISHESFGTLLVDTIAQHGLHAVGLIGGPPCQAFSRGNVKAKADDPRRRLLTHYTALPRLLNSHGIEVPFLVLENVAGLLREANRNVLDEALTQLRSDGYTVQYSVLNSLEYGVPQTRRRFFAVATKHPWSFAWPTAIKKHPTTVREAIEHLPEPAYNQRRPVPADFPYHCNHWTSRRRSSRFAEQRFNRWRSFRLLDWDSPSPTVAYGNREIHVHPSGTRRLSILEGMILQGFPESYELLGNFSEQVKQVSNAVPPPLAKAIAMSLSPQAPSHD